MCMAAGVLLPNAEADLLAGVARGGPTGLGGIEIARGGGLYGDSSIGSYSLGSADHGRRGAVWGAGA